mgnify:CR=1 FL=1
MAEEIQDRPARYEDLYALPENRVGEILGGDLVTHPRPGPRHANSASRLGMVVGPPFDMGSGGPGGWWILDEPELHLDDDILVPDLAGWRRERMPELPDTAWFEVVPDWVCEVVSPGTARTDRVLKMPRYARHGVGWCWMVDPANRTVEAFQRSDAETWLLVGTVAEAMEAALPPFDAVTLDFAPLWADTPAPE